MTPSEVLNIGGAVLFALTLISAVRAASFHRDTHRLNIALVVTTLYVASWIRQPAGLGYYIRTTLVLISPFLLLRLVDLFREVTRLVRLSVLTAGLIGVVLLLYRQSWSGFTVSTYLAALLAYPAWAFTAEVGRTAGVTRMRLLAAAVGTWLFALSFAFVALSLGTGFDQQALVRGLQKLTFISFFFAFATPRFLRARWQREEQAKYVSLTAERDAEERGKRAPEDLIRAMSGSVGNAATVVALRETPLAAELVVAASSDASLVGTRIPSGSGALTQACLSGKPVFVTPDRCEPELASRLARYGSQVLVAPVATTVHTWGVVLVVQRRGSLFPDDDLTLLAQLGKYAGTALDHAHLVAEARQRASRTADRRLREAESRMDLMLASIKDYAMFILDDHGKVVTWHIGGAHVFGYSSHEMADESAVALFDMTPEAFTAWLKDARELGLAEREGPCRRKDGGKFIGGTVLRPLADDGEGLSGFVGVTHDVTERRELEARLRQSQRLEAIGQLAGGIAHDFNNMLTAIMGYGEFLKMELAEDLPARERVSDILGAAGRAAGLTRQLLAFSRRQLMQPVPFSLSRQVSEMLPMLRQVIGEHVAVVDELPLEIAPVFGDRSQVEQIVMNLAVNARDAMPSGGRLTLRTAEVWLDDATAGRDVAVPGMYVQLEVADTGLGMDAATQARIFEPFFTTKEFGRGTGLGLSTVYGIVKQMGGVIHVSSELGKGATFRLLFPAARVREPIGAEKTAAEPKASVGTETILVVEDDADVRSFLTQTLQKHGYRVMSAENRVSALVLAEAHLGPIDLVIADVLMPGGTGPELVRALNEMRPGIPYLYISGYADGVLAQQGSLPKASHFLQKPFSTADVLGRIRQILARA